MNSAFPIILVAEFVFPPLLLAIILLIVHFKRSKKNQSVCESLAESSASEAKEQKQLLSKWLTEELGYKDEDLENAVDNMMDWRNALFKNFIHGYLKQDEELLKGFSHDFAVYFKQYTELKNKIEPEPEEDTEAQDQVKQLTEVKENLEQQIDELETHTKKVEKEKEVTLSTLNNLFSEYMTMFGDDVDAGDMTVEEIIDAMEAISSEDDDEEEEIDLPQNSEPATEKPAEKSKMEDEELVPEEPGWDDAIAESEPAEPVDEELVPEEPDWSKEDEDDSDSASDSLATDDAGKDDDEPSWEDAFSEEGDESEPAEPEAKPTKPEAKQESEEEPSWEDAFSEEGDESEPAEPEAKTSKPEAKQKSEEEPSWEDAFSEEDETDSEPSWEDAFSESDDEPEVEKTEEKSGEESDADDEEPSWEDAFSEMDGDDDEEPNWEDAFTEVGKDKK